jgi:hypothetical protein
VNVGVEQLLHSAVHAVAQTKLRSEYPGSSVRARIKKD